MAHLAVEAHNFPSQKQLLLFVVEFGIERNQKRQLFSGNLLLFVCLIGIEKGFEIAGSFGVKIGGGFLKEKM